jgi:tRNA-Thr(GGU) m(6)t(6)A37 methyltransferase TsaA
MSNKATDQNETFRIQPIGHVRRAASGTYLEILQPYQAALKELEHFSHVMVLWWADRHDSEGSRGMLQTEPPYAEGRVTGVFATRAEYRPNPIGLTTCKILDVEEGDGIVHIANIDAFDDTPIMDLKAYFPVCDRVQGASIPDWLVGWPEWMPDEGLGLEVYEVEEE